MLTLRSLLVLALLAAPFAALSVEPSARAIDGDTLELGGERIRLFGIDAPERNQTCDRNGQSWKCGIWATRMLAETIAQGAVHCVAQDRDRYGRTVAICHVARPVTSGESRGVDVAAAQVQAGAAQAYLRYSGRYAEDQAKARSARRGIWDTHMITPEAHRHKADAPQPEITQGCAIKGNIGASGKVYHIPGQRDYAAVRISTAKGEAMFCTEAAAQAAGFRAALR